MSLLFLRAPKTPPPGLAHTEEPIRSELFSVERLEQHGETLAVAQRVTDRPGRGSPMAARVRDNGRVLLEAYRSIAGAIREERAITPAAEWLVDNFHVVEEQIREIRDDLPRGFYRQLPKLAEGPLEGYPRVFGIAWAYVAHTDSHFDTQTLARFVQAYQRVQPLTIGELWAVAITLRIVLVENLRRAAEQIGASRAERQRADLLADRLLGANGRDAEPAEVVFKDFERSPVPAAFAVEMVQRLRDQDAKVAPALHWLDQRLAAQGTTADEIVREVHQGQGAMNVTVRNVITSMRLMSAVDWADFFESVSAVDAVLRADSDFAAMDFATRDRYRHAIEKLALGSGHTEIEVAQSAIDSAKGAAAEKPIGDGVTARREHHPGYYLISEGRHALEAKLGFRAPVRDWIARANKAAGIKGYLGTIAVVTAIIVAGGLLAIADARIGGWTRFILAMLAIIPAMDAAVALVNRAVTTVIGPATIPALELHDGVPPSLRTIVVMPTLLTTRAEIDEQIERLEVHYLASPDGELYFALLSDLDRLGDRNRAWRRRPAGGSDGGNRASESTSWTGAGRREIFVAPSPARLGRSRRRVDGLGAQARQAARAESAAARRDRYHVRRVGRASADCPRRRALRDHARCRYAPPARRRQADGRQNGASAECAAIRPATRPRDRRSRSSAAANHGFAADRTRRIGFPARVLERRRNRSVRVRRFRRLPGSPRSKARTAAKGFTMWTCSRPRSRAAFPTTRC